MISSPYCAVSAPQCLWVSRDGMRIDVIRYEPLTLSLRLLKFFFQQSLWFLKLQSCFIKWYHKKRNIKLRINNSGWQRNVTFCDVLHEPKQKKRREQTLESAQYGLEIIFKSAGSTVKQRLSTIYKQQKPGGTRFVQMVSKNSRMGNSVGIGVYHLRNPFKFTERVWREAKSWEYTNGKHVFRLEIPFGNFGLPFKRSRFLRKFSV